MITTSFLRHQFLDFFKKQGHHIYPSASLIPHQDPSLLFVNAGMVPFKNYFTGHEKPDFLKAASVQKCVRAGGKHNDLENVGYTQRHHTFFEMLGNFSFGDYFKEEAIYFAWTFLHDILMLPKDRLWVTVYHTDDEAALIWKKVAGFGDDKIIRISNDDNFWRMGDTGPCGPCTEVFYDHGPHIEGGLPGTPEQDGDRFVEIWNLVFMEQEVKKEGDGFKTISLPRPAIDTGSGLERLAAVVQGVHSTYDTDLFKGIIEASKDLSDQSHPESSSVHRIIADHLRSSCFLIADGILPGNEGRDYVLRRIMRRAMRHSLSLSPKEPFMHRLVPTLIGFMGEAYPELKQAEALMVQTLKREEETFRLTLDRGLKELSKLQEKIPTDGVLSGESAFKLYDTYGFPLDLTRDILKESSQSLDEKGFDHCMKAQKARAKASWSGSGEVLCQGTLTDLTRQCGKTTFTGYEVLKDQGTIIALLKDNHALDEAFEGPVTIVVDQTPFYAEGGGQVGDQGVIQGASGQGKIQDTKKTPGGLIYHHMTIECGSFKVGERVDLCVDKKRRQAITRHHSATHVIHHVLQSYLGPHVSQKGSYVGPDYLRFDFTHDTSLTEKDIACLEEKINDTLLDNSPTDIAFMDLKQAKSSGALALFGEKYDDTVRVVTLGVQDKNTYASKELCGGTHVERTGDIGLIKILATSSVASGVKRLEAVAGSAALQEFQKQCTWGARVCEKLKTGQDKVMDRLEKLLQSGKQKQKGMGDTSFSNEDFKENHVQDKHLFWVEGQDMNPKDMKSRSQAMTNHREKTACLMVSTTQKKVSLVLSLSKDLTSTYDASFFIRNNTPHVGGQGGGGRKDLAQGGGSNPAGIPKVIQNFKAFFS